MVLEERPSCKSNVQDQHINVTSESFLDLGEGWEKAVAAHPEIEGVFTKHRAVHATMKFMDGSMTASQCQSWADVVLASKAVRLEVGNEYELAEFLQEWSSSGSVPIDRDSVDVWQSRLAHD